MPRLALRSVFWTALIPLLLAVIVAFSAVSSASRDSCDTLLKAGRYLDANSFEPKTWQPVGCSLNPYLDHTLFGNFSACLAPGDEIIVLGGRSARAIYHGLVQTLKPSDPGHLETASKSAAAATAAGVQLRLLWAPLLNGSAAEQLLDIAQHGVRSPYKAAAVKTANKTGNSAPLKTFLLVTPGAEFVSADLSGFSANLKRIVQAVRASQHFEKAYFAPAMIPHHSWLEEKDTVTPEKVAKLVQVSDEYFNYDPVSQTGGVIYGSRQSTKNTPAMYYVPVFNDLGGLQHLELYRPDTMSYIDETRSIQASILLNHMFNQRLAASPGFPVTGTCCVVRPGMSALAAFTVAVSVIISAGLLGLRAQLSFASAAAVLGAGAAVAGYVDAADRTHAFVHAAISYSPAQVLLPLLQVIACVALLRLRPDSQPATTAHAGAGPERRVGSLLVREIQGLCLLLLLVIEVSGYDVVRDRFEGELLARVLYSSWATAAVYDFACSYMALLCDGASRDAVKYCALHTARTCFLPLLITLQSGSEDLPRSLALVSPITVKLLFWCAFVTVVAPLAFAALRLARAHANFVRVIARYSILILTALLTYFLLRETASDNQDLGAKAAAGVFDFQVDHPVLADFWVVFGAVLAAWWYYSAEPTLSEKQNTGGPSMRVALSAGAALSVLVSALYRFFRFPLLSLRGSYIVTASIDFNPRFYLQTLAQRGAAYTPLVHFAVCVAVLSLWLVARAGILAHTSRNSLYYYSSACLFVAACGYEMLVLRRHVLQTAPGRGLLVLLPGGLGTAHTPPPAASAPRDTHATDWDLLARYWLNLALVAGVFVCAARACSAGWEACVDTREEEEEQEKCAEEC